MSQTLIQIKPARELLLFLLGTHLGAMVCVGFLTIGLSYKVLVCSLCLASLSYLFWRDIFLSSPKSIIKICYENSNTWCLYHKNGNTVSAILQNHSIVTPYFILLNFKPQVGWLCRSVFLSKTSLSNDEFRRLRLRVLGFL